MGKWILKWWWKLVDNMVPLDEKAIYTQVMTSIEQELGEVLNPGDERRIVTGNILAAMFSVINQGNAFAKAQYLRYSYGTQLDELGVLVGAYRMDSAPAQVDLKFTVTAPTGITVTIPMGTRVTPDGKCFFSTNNVVAIPWDVPNALVSATAQEVGVLGNGYPVGAIATIVDPIPYLTKVSNVVPSAGGFNAEDDDSFRERIRTAPGHYSSAGPVKAYEWYAKSADSTVGDVDIQSPGNLQVLITVLLKGGFIPTQDILDKVLAKLSPDEVRPLNDQVIVKAPVVQNYNINAKYYIYEGDSVDEQKIRAAVEQALGEYQLWQKSRLGRAINPDELRRRLLIAGVYRLDIVSPVFTVVARDNVAVCTTATLIYGGLLK